MAEDDKYSKREVVAVVMFASEGDNREDAKELGSRVVAGLPHVEGPEARNWVFPQSWEGAFGEGPAVGAEGGLFW
jgi:hypothetical protein